MNPLLVKAGIAVAVTTVAFVYMLWKWSRSEEMMTVREVESYGNIRGNQFDEKNIKVCCVCLNEFGSSSNQDLVILPCRHKYHKVCIHEVFKQETRNKCLCPLCRQPVSELFIQNSF